MVQISLRKAGCLAGLLATTLLTMAFIVLFTDVGRHGHAAHVRSIPDPLDVADHGRFAPPSPMPLDPAQKDELGKVYLAIVQAYSNRQVKVLCEWRRKLPERVERVRRSDLDDVETPFSNVLYNEVIPRLGRKLESRHILSEYSRADDFERSVATMLAFAGIYGDVQLRRREFGGRFGDIEMLVVYRLKSYRDCFHSAGRADLERVADRFLAEWIGQIESENGYTKALVADSVAWVQKWGDEIMVNTGQAWKEVSQNVVRQFTYGLILAGCTPKWLEEFKDIPRHASQMEESSKK